MEILRTNGDSVLNAQIASFTISDVEGIVDINLYTYAQNTHYKLILRGDDVEALKRLFHKFEGTLL